MIDPTTLYLASHTVGRFY